MKKKFLLGAGVILASVMLAGCVGQSQPPASPNPPVLPPKPNSQQTNVDPDRATNVENEAPKQATDLPTAINETDKDIQVIDNDLKQIDQINMDESDANVE